MPKAGGDKPGALPQGEQLAETGSLFSRHAKARHKWRTAVLGPAAQSDLQDKDFGCRVHQ